MHDGDFDMSASVKAYFALKMIGDVDAPHMVRAREAIRSRGGAGHSRSSRASCWRCSACSPGAASRDAGSDHAAAEWFRST